MAYYSKIEAVNNANIVDLEGLKKVLEENSISHLHIRATGINPESYIDSFRVFYQAYTDAYVVEIEYYNENEDDILTFDYVESVSEILKIAEEHFFNLV